MSFPSFASQSDLEAWQGAPVDSTRAGSVLRAVSTRIRSYTGRVWVDDTGPLEGVTGQQVDMLRDICVAEASRIYKNPDGLTQQTSGPFSASRADWAAKGAQLSDEAKDELAALVGNIAGLGVISTTRGPVETAAVRRW